MGGVGLFLVSAQQRVSCTSGANGLKPLRHKDFRHPSRRGHLSVFTYSINNFLPSSPVSVSPVMQTRHLSEYPRNSHVRRIFALSIIGR